MSPMMSRVLVAVVLFGYAFCEEKNATSTPTTTAVIGNSTSSVTIEHKTTNVTVDYKSDHQSANSSYNVGTFGKSNSTEKPLIITTSKEVRVIQAASEFNESSTAASVLKSNDSSPHLNEIKPVSRHGITKTTRPPFLPTINTPGGKIMTKPTSPLPYTLTSKEIRRAKNTTASSNSTTNKNTTAPNKPKPRNELLVEKMEVKEMRSMSMAQENNRFDFFIVADDDKDEQNRSFSSQMFTMKVPKSTPKPKSNFGTQTEFKPISYSRPEPYARSHDRKRNQLNFNYFNSPETTTRTNYWNISLTTSEPINFRQKVNSSIETEAAQKGARDFSCLRCVGNRGNKDRSKYPNYVAKDLEAIRAVKLYGPDGDSILEGSNQHLTVSKPGKSLESAQHVAANGLGKGRRTAYYGGKVAGMPSSIGYSTESAYKPSTHGGSDLYNLDDELESSGSSVSTTKSHVKYEHHEVHIPYPVKIEKKVSYPIHIKVDRPVPVHVEKPYPVHVEKKVPVPVKVPVPQPYPVEKEIPYPVKIPIEVPRPVEVAKPVPYIVENPVPVQVFKHVKVPVKVPVDVPVPYKVPVHVEKRVPYFVEKKTPFEVPVPVEKPYLVHVKKPFEVPVEKPQAVTVEKKIPVPVQVVEFIKVPVPVKMPHQQWGFQNRLGTEPAFSRRTAELPVGLPEEITVEFLPEAHPAP